MQHENLQYVTNHIVTRKMLACLFVRYSDSCNICKGLCLLSQTHLRHERVDILSWWVFQQLMLDWLLNRQDSWSVEQMAVLNIGLILQRSILAIDSVESSTCSHQAALWRRKYRPLQRPQVIACERSWCCEPALLSAHYPFFLMIFDLHFHWYFDLAPRIEEEDEHTCWTRLASSHI